MCFIEIVSSRRLDQIGNIHRHFVNLGRIVLFNITQNSNVIVLQETIVGKTCENCWKMHANYCKMHANCWKMHRKFKKKIFWTYSDKIDCNTLSAITTGSTNAMNVQLTIVWQIVVDNERHLAEHFKNWTKCHFSGYLWDIETTCPNIGRD